MNAVPEREVELYADEVLAKCEQRRQLGVQKYGGHTFIERDMITYMQEELEDAINYSIFLHYKLEKMRSDIDAMRKEIAGASSSDTADSTVGEVREVHELSSDADAPDRTE